MFSTVVTSAVGYRVTCSVDMCPECPWFVADSVLDAGVDTIVSKGLVEKDLAEGNRHTETKLGGRVSLEI